MSNEKRSGGNSIHNPNLERRGSGSAGVPGNNIGGGRSSGGTGASAGASVPPPSPRPLIRVPSRGSLDDLRRPLSSRNLQVQSRPVLTRSQSSLWSGGSGGQNQHPHHHQPVVFLSDEVEMEGRKMDLKKWSIFAILEKEFLAQIRLACVFGNLGNEALMISHDDEVYAVGSNGAGCLGLGDMHSTLLPKKVEPLTQKGVVGFAHGSGPHVLAYTSTGELYSWGHNGYCQLGNGTSNQGLTPTLVQGALAGKTVVDVACGSHHSVCLTSEGEIYAWGQNNCGQIGSGTTTNQSTPRKVSATLGKRAISISCGQTSTMVALENGDVYGWGYNGNGQLGLGNNINQLTPCRVTTLQGVVIRKIVCGYAHTMALSDEGDLYTWGANSYGQLGTGNKSNCCSPTRVAEELGRIVDIAAIHYCHISAIVSQISNKTYMWGHCHGQSVVVPTETPFGSIHEVFASFAAPCVTHLPMVTEVQTGLSVLDSLSQAFDDPVTCDVKFLIVEDSREIHVHKAVLKIRCEHFRSMFQDHWEEGGQDLVKIHQFSYSVYRAFLKYLYTDEVDLPPEDAIGLLDLANSYCEQQLKRRCEGLIRQGITVENVAMLYATAIKYQAEELEEFCFRFSLDHMTAVAQTEAFAKLDEQTLKEFVIKAAVHGAFKS